MRIARGFRTTPTRWASLRTLSLAMAAAILTAALPAAQSTAAAPPVPAGWQITQTSDGKVKAVFIGEPRIEAAEPTSNTVVASATRYAGPAGGGAWPAWPMAKAGSGIANGGGNGNGSDKAGTAMADKGTAATEEGAPSGDPFSWGRSAPVASADTSQIADNNKGGANGTVVATGVGGLSVSGGGEAEKCDYNNDWWNCGDGWKWDCRANCWWWWSSWRHCWIKRDRNSDWWGNNWWWNSHSDCWWWWDWKGRCWRKGNPPNCSPS